MSAARQRFLDRTSLVGMGLSIALMLQPFWSAGFRVGFFCTLAFTLMQIVVSHLPARGEA